MGLFAGETQADGSEAQGKGKDGAKARQGTNEADAAEYASYGGPMEKQ